MAEESMVEESKIQALRTTLRGQLLRSEDSEYDGARKVFNAMIDPACVDRSLCRRGRCHCLCALCPGAQSTALCPRRWSQHRWYRRMRRRSGD